MQASRSLLLAAVLSSLSSLAVAAGAIQGQVLDSISKEPLAQAQVTLSAREYSGALQATTAADGSYRFDNLVPATYQLQVEQDGYQPLQMNELPLRGDRTLRVNLPLLPRLEN